MASNAPIRLRARWVVPVETEPFEDGEIVLHQGAILEVRQRPVSGEPAPDCTDLGEAALLPGLVNVHTHLDYTAFRGLLEDLEFVSWIRQLTRRRSVLDEEDYLCSATLGAAECAAAGVTTIGDCTSTGASLIGGRKVGLRGVIFQEVFGIDPAVSDDDAMRHLQEAVTRLRAEANGTLLNVGVSPHAPYTLRPSLLTRVADWTRTEQLPTCTHVAESEAEDQLIRRGEGELSLLFASRGISWDPPGCSPVEYLGRCGLVTDRSLLVHGVWAEPEDMVFAARRGAAWAHCPKSNAKLGNGIAPLLRMLAAAKDGHPRVGLGSDSVASNNSVDLFEEMRCALLQQRASARDGTYPGARTALEMATLGGARALGLDQFIGSLAPGKRADVVAVSLSGLNVRSVHDPVAAIVWSATARDVILTMVDGEPLYQYGCFTRVQPQSLLPSLETAAEKIRHAG